MAESKWNESIKITSTDRLFARVIGPLIPKSVQPNHITVFRMLLIPFVLYFLDRGRYGIGVPLFLFAALTDWFDGALARTRRQITDWGIVYDPIADKLLIVSVLLLIVLEHIHLWLGIALLGIEIVLITGGWYRKLHGKIEPANIWGKRKMFAEVVGILLVLLALWFRVNLLTDASTGTLSLAVIFAILSIFVGIK